jgi:hypothetical protein
MRESIKSVFAQECADLKIDAAFIKRLHNYQVSFVNKNDDHIALFGGHLLGVHVVRFTPADQDRWFDEILEVDPNPLEERLLALPDVNEDFIVSSNTMNISCVWLAHAIMESKLLSDQQKQDGMVDAMLVLQYKFLTSLLYQRFRYPADPAVAEATYAQLSYKFAIKQHGNWFALLKARAESIIEKSSIHRRVFEKMDSDLDVVYMLNDSQGRIRDIVKNIYGVFKTVHSQGVKITSTSGVVEHDGQEILKDKTKNASAYVRYINAVITDRQSFMREELLGVVEKLMHTMPPRLFRETLVWMSDNYRQSGAQVIEEVITEVLLHSFEYLSDNRALVRNENDLPGLLSRLRGVYMSSRSSEEAVLSLREKTEYMVKQATGSKSGSVIASVRTGVLLYLLCRAYTMKHYSSQ